jgi:hypothetical protein
MIICCPTTDRRDLNLEEAKIITWFQVGLYREFIRLSKKHRRLLENELLILNEPIGFNSEGKDIETLDMLPENNKLFNVY